MLSKILTPTILFVATLSSPLTARWINQLADTEWDVHVFGVNDEVHPLLCAKNITIHVVKNVENSGASTIRLHRDLWPFPMHGRGRVKKKFPKLTRWFIKDAQDHLLDIVLNLKPDIVHSLKMQNETYLTYEVLQKIPHPKRPKWLYSTWGSDIYIYRHYPEHCMKIETILPQIDYLMADNPRDVTLSLEHGFSGEVLGVFPTGGGYPIDEMRQYVTKPPSERRIIAIKGTQAINGGQVLTALEAVKQCAEKIQGYRIVVHSAIGTYASGQFSEVEAYAQAVSRLTNLHIEFLPFSPTEKIWELFGASRIGLAISKADGTPNAMLEAMTVGAFPIQSDTGGLDTWIESGKNGYLVKFDDVKEIATALLKAIENDTLVDQAANINYKLTEIQLEFGNVRKKVLDAYTSVLAKNSTSK